MLTEAKVKGVKANLAMSKIRQLEDDISTSFVCDCEEWMRSACAGEIFYKESEGKQYCVLHYPGREKIEAFRSALKTKLDSKDFDFSGVWFPEEVGFQDVQFSTGAIFNKAIFSAGASFYRASFSVCANFIAASFGVRANFIAARFSAGALFNNAIFSEDADFTAAIFTADANFNGAIFSADAYFMSVRFSANATFSGTSFVTDADFRGARFNACVNFATANISSYLRFAGGKDKQVFRKDLYLSLQHARFEKPKRVSFHTLELRPHWFVNVDARKFEFVNVEWSNNLEQEVESLRYEVNTSPHKLLSIAYRQLAVNAEENHRYGEAADFRYCSMDVWRLEWLRGRNNWKSHPKAVMKTSSRLIRSLRRNNSNHRRTVRRIKLFTLAYGKGLHVLHWLYWMASGYGERVTRAVAVLIALWLVFAYLYTGTGFERKTSLTSNAQITMPAQEDEIGKPLPFKRALTYSLGVMSLQKPDPKPLTNTAQTLVSLETVLGPIQAALLALAIRRRFMR